MCYVLHLILLFVRAAIRLNLEYFDCVSRSSPIGQSTKLYFLIAMGIREFFWIFTGKKFIFVYQKKTSSAYWSVVDSFGTQEGTIVEKVALFFFCILSLLLFKILLLDLYAYQHMLASFCYVHSKAPIK